MITSFKINGKRATEAEFRVLEEALTGACGTPAFADGELTKKEAIALLTKGQKSVSASTFLQVCKSYITRYSGYVPISILSDYGVSVARLTKRAELAKSVQQNGKLLLYATSRDRHDPELAVMALHSGASYVYSSLPESMQADPFIAQEAIMSAKELVWLPKSLESNLNFMRAAVTIDPRQFSGAPVLMHHERATVMDVVSRAGAMLSAAAPQFWEDRTVVKTALEHFSYEFQKLANILPLEYYSDPELMLSAALNSPKDVLGQLQKVNSPLLKDAAFIATLRQHWRGTHDNVRLTDAQYGLPFDNNELSDEANALKINPKYFETPPEYADGHSFTPDAVVYYLGRKMDAIKMPYPAGMFDSYAHYRQALKGITQFPERFTSLESILTIWHNRITIDSTGDHRPIALALYNVSDWNGAFESKELMKGLLAEGRFRVFYEEVPTDIAAENIIKWVSQNGRRPIHTLAFAGHGSQKELQLSKSKYRGEEEIDIDDFKKPFWRSLGHYLAPNGNVLLYACSTGLGGTGVNNLANAMAAAVPEAVTVYSSSLPSNIATIWIMPDLKLGVRWFEKSSYNPHETRK